MRRYQSHRPRLPGYGWYGYSQFSVRSHPVEHEYNFPYFLDFAISINPGQGLSTCLDPCLDSRHHPLWTPLPAPSCNGASEHRFSAEQTAVAFHVRGVAPSCSRVRFRPGVRPVDLWMLLSVCLPTVSWGTYLSQGSVGGWACLRHVGNGRQDSKTGIHLDRSPFPHT